MSNTTFVEQQDMNLETISFTSEPEAVAYLMEKAEMQIDDISSWTLKINCGVLSLAEYVKKAKETDHDLKKYLDTLSKAQEEITEQNRKQAEEQLRRESVESWLIDFDNYVKKTKDQRQIKTGFPSLDKLLDGGLFPGLYVLGAISSLGKTTFALQMADQIAKSGEDVLIFSLEMAPEELCAKTISRLTLRKSLITIQKNKSLTEEQKKAYIKKNAKTTRGILNGRLHDSYSSEEMTIIADSINEYGEYAKHINIKQGFGNVSVTKTKGNISIEEELERYRQIKGKAPVVIIDYIQILAPYVDEKHPARNLTDKQSMDKNVLELKRLSRDYDTTIIGISSLNRESYTEPMTMKAFKESGAIEYSSDVLIGLQYEGMDYNPIVDSTDKVRKARVQGIIEQASKDGKEGNAQHIEVKVLKNRNGVRDSIILDLYPKYNYYTEHQKKGTWEETKEATPFD